MKHRFSIWRYFLDGAPEYLARHYWWAYLWKPAIWFFDHQPIINCILFGQYQRLLDQTLKQLDGHLAGRLLQLTCVYGKLTPKLVKTRHNDALYIVDVCQEQLQASLRKLKPAEQDHLIATRMNAENLAFSNDSFSTVLIFFLMHELPARARKNVLLETLRVLTPGSRLLITEYGYLPDKHWIYRFAPLRQQLLFWEPFLDGFWREDLTEELQKAASHWNKKITLKQKKLVFNGFYRVVCYQVD
ncbi:MAG: class I SAM-dependent methyltransferase [Gammaproteobacteria bacterium]|nr:class I SAM-dependent methyltransferase [Gammaproteobacteria bacterium]